MNEAVKNGGRMRLVQANPDLQPIAANIGVGRDESMEEQLFAKSKQPRILKYTPNDAKNRFCNQQSFEKWLSKNRTLTWLVSPGGDLAGILWYGPKTFPLDLSLPETPTETLGLRLYEGYQGHGLAAPFMLQSLAIVTMIKRERGERATGIWIETGTDNAAAFAVYAAVGYKEVDRDEDRITLVLSEGQIDKITDDQGIIQRKAVGKET